MVKKNPPANAGKADLIPGSGRFLGEGNGNPFQYSRLGSPMNRGAWWATVHGVAKELDATGGSDGKASACNSGDPGSIPGLGRSPGEGNGNTLQYSCLENFMDGGAW